jgi:hypothetical protein
MKDIMDIPLFCYSENIKLVYDESWVVKSKVGFSLDKNAQSLVYQWFRSLRFLDGHISNISKLMNLEDCRLYKIKSYECHVFIQTLIQLACQDLLSKGIWDAFTKISHFFRDICYKWIFSKQSADLR